MNARCCQVSGLTCDYKTAGPSFPFDGVMAEARCDAGDVALGEFVMNSVHSRTRQSCLEFNNNKNNNTVLNT